ncbi:MAG: decarboxylating NADP(+)-dependent phosphogluconate dehydrogenase, partial [Singulisphaera sp.]|nr:decarboxylating NADP(+)-dependent phosphogluconate dehydrogenase [Singulisphaera sp.]
MTTPSAEIGLIGLAVMGENLVLNMESHGFTVAVFNRTTSKVDKFINGRGKGKKLVGCHSIKELVASLKRPRKIMMMVKAGPAVDEVIEELLPYLEPGDILIDGGNTHYPDTTRRTRDLKKRGFLFIGTGVSGGEEGALRGPSIMPGGDPDAWPHVKPIFQAIAAKVADGTPCCDWVGNEGAGHYVKMVHNGIEYGDIQLIDEAYDLMRSVLGMSPDAQHEVFARWNTGPLDSYLIEITRDILAYKDPESGKPMVDLILDTAGQKGTGKWTVDSALDLGTPLTLIAEAVFSRCLSAQKDERVAASKVLKGPSTQFSGNPQQFIDDIEMALYASKIISYAQGYVLMNAMAKESGWKMNNGGIALMWRGGCIIRSAFLGKIKEAFDRDPDLT